MSSHRQFERFAISEDALATDAQGRLLGRVMTAGGGGMAIHLVDPAAFVVGQQLRVTVVEPRSDIRHTIDVVVRYVHEGTAGVEFVTGPEA